MTLPKEMPPWKTPQLPRHGEAVKDATRAATLLWAIIRAGTALRTSLPLAGSDRASTGWRPAEKLTKTTYLRVARPWSEMTLITSCVAALLVADGAGWLLCALPPKTVSAKTTTTATTAAAARARAATRLSARYVRTLSC